MADHFSAFGATSSPPYVILQLAGTYNVWRVIGTTPTQITPFVDGVDFNESMSNPLVSPDGTMIVYDQNFPGPNFEGQIQVVDSGGGTPTTISPDDAGGPWMIHPQWGPNSDRVVYIHADPGNGFNGSIVEVELATPGVEAVLYTPSPVGTPNGYGPYRPQYSRDGTMILFFLNDESGATDTLTGLYVMDSDGSNVTQLDTWSTIGPPNDGYGFDGSQAQWTADNRIVYANTAFAGGPSQVYVIDADGSNQTLLSSDETSTQACRVSNRCLAPGDAYVVCSSFYTTGSVWVPYRLELNGSGDTRLNDTEGPYGTADNFRCVYVAEGRIWFIDEGAASNPGKVGSMALDGSGFRIDHTISDNGVGDLFYAGTGFEWI